MSDQAPTFRITRRRFQRTDPASALRAVEERPVRRIVLTGGPGSGKSTAASFLAREFPGDLWVLPESATLLYRGGMPRGITARGTEIAQRAIFNTQRSLELASREQHPGRVQVCDRGTVDGAAYWPSGGESFFRAMGTTHESELARYDAVIFLHTAAHLPAGYERDLEVRTEDAAAAIELDVRIEQLYVQHPRFVAVRSRGSFLDKLIEVREAVAVLLGHDGDLSRRRPDVPLSALAPLAGIDTLAGVTR